MKPLSHWVLTGLLCAAGSTLAQAAAPVATPPATPAATASSPAPETSEAEVRKVDASAGNITLKHGEIKNLEMPPMSMVFRVKDPALLGQAKAAAKVRFTAERINGIYTVTSLEHLP